MNKPVCSKEWTAEERLKLIAWYLDHLSGYPLDREHNLIRTCYLLADMPATFLENNRANIEDPTAGLKVKEKQS